MKIQFFILFLFLSFYSFSQSDTIIYFGVNGEVMDQSHEYIKTKIDYKGEKRIHLDTYHFINEDWKLVVEEKWKKNASDQYTIKIQKADKKSTIERTINTDEEGNFVFTDSINNKLYRSGTSLRKVPLLFHGEVREYYPNGRIKAIEQYENNQMMSNKNWREDGTQYFSDLYYSVEQFPTYSKGNDVLNAEILNFLRKHKLDFSEIRGRLIIGFVVFENGKIGGFKVIESIDEEIDELVIRAFMNLSGSWNPARHRDKQVKFFQKFPVNFIHDEYQLEFFDFYSGIAQFERR